MQDHTPSEIGSLLPPAQADWFLQARACYQQSKFDDALKIDERLLDWASSTADPFGLILGHRFVGLCHFRKESLDESERHLRTALDLAEAQSQKHQALLCANHLGATLRRKGQLLDAYELLKKYLQQASLPNFLHERARLLGNFGALLDQLGQRAAADDCYSRMEELCELHGNPDRLANARGLAARSAEARGDLQTALAKYEEEARLAEQAGNAARQLAATLHVAKVHRLLNHGERAEQLSCEALKLAQELKHTSRLVDAWEGHAKILHANGNLAGALAAINSVGAELKRSSDHAEKRANILHARAKICRDAGLFGEALHCLKESARLRKKLFEPLRQNDQVRQMSSARFDELESLARELLNEAHSVVRSEEERQAVLELARQIWAPSDSAESISLEEMEKRLGVLPQPSIQVWADSAEEAAHKLWSERLLPKCFTKLRPESQEDLLRAERSYTAVVDDFPRVIHLFAIVIERELKYRLIAPALLELKLTKHECRDWLKLTLGDILSLLADSKIKKGSSLPCYAEVTHKISRLKSQHQGLFTKIGSLRQAIHPVDERRDTFKVVEIRNAVAHGTESPNLQTLDRLMVDAVKRALVLDDDPPFLAQLTELPLVSFPLDAKEARK